MSNKDKSQGLVVPPGFFVKAYTVLIEQFSYKTSLVYGHVHDYCRSMDKETGEVINECWRSEPGIASELAMALCTVKKALKELTESGWLNKQSRPGKTSIYSIPVAIPIPTHTENSMGTPIENGMGSHIENGIRTEVVTDKTTDKEVVVNSEDENLESLTLYASKKNSIRDPKAWAIAMQRKGFTLSDVISQKPRNRKNEYKDPDSDEARQQYVEGEFADFWEDTAS